MSRAIIIGIVVAVALTIYAVVDCAMTDAKRTKILQKPIWLVIILLIPVIGPALWIFLGKAPANHEPKPSLAPEDQAYFEQLTADGEHDDRIAELEEQMRLLDEEIERDRQNTMRNHPSTGSHPTIDPDKDDKKSDDESDDTTAENGDEEGRSS